MPIAIRAVPVAMSSPTTILPSALFRALVTTNPRRFPNSPLLFFSPVLSSSCSSQQTRPFRTSASPLLGKGKTNLPPRPKPPPEHEIEESFLKGSGPGGQKINKTSSAVQLKHLPTGLVVKSQATRSRNQNRAVARRLLADKLDDLARGAESRSAVVGAVRSKKKASAAKKSRRKYRKLQQKQDEGQEGVEQEEEEEEEEGEVEEDSAPRNTNNTNHGKESRAS
ncbi:RF-1 domain-containing protein [Biscogniauxia mediterranea]|nr:RF-1 domain-containing protein [Biscogniauxia mediterranea]